MGTSPSQTTPAAPQMPTLHPGQMIHPFLHAVGLVVTQIWWLIALAILVQAVRSIGPLRRRRRLNRAGMAELDRMDWREFEHAVAALFRQLEYSTEVVGQAAGDYGADLVITRGDRTVVQVKHRTGRNVGIDAVNQVVASRRTYGADRTMVVTNWYFTRAARKQALHNDVELWDRDQLAEELLQARATTSETPMTVPGPSVSDQAHCARCGKRVSEKVRAYCQARPKRYGGLVYCYDHQGV